jgi:hypothetical protein
VPVFGAGRPAFVADLVHESGATMGVSRYDDEPGWGVDSAISANGMPQWVNGVGARYLSVRMVGDDGAALLDAAAAELELATCDVDGCGRDATSGEEHNGRMYPVCDVHAV